MKIKVEYEKTESGEIKTCITVVDNQDYPSVYIFEDDEDYPGKGCFSLEPSNQPYIIFVAETPEKAREKAQVQVWALKRHLEDWRAVTVPKNEEYTI